MPCADSLMTGHKKSTHEFSQVLDFIGTPKGNRTPVTGVRVGNSRYIHQPFSSHESFVYKHLHPYCIPITSLLFYTLFR